MEYINVNLGNGRAGLRNGKPKGVVIHNDAGSMSAKQYLDWLKRHNFEAGFAHYYIDRFTTARIENTYACAWHTGNSEGNYWYIGFEVVESMSASDKDFLANEQAVFKQAAEDLKYYSLPVNRNTVRLHKEFSPTACPHRSWDLHGRSINAVKDYFISQILKYYNGGSTEKPVAPKPPVSNGFDINNYHTTKPSQIKLVKNDYAYKEKSLKTKVNPIVKKNTILTVTDLVYEGKYPRYKLKSGLYITTRKDTVTPISSPVSKKGTFKNGDTQIQVRVNGYGLNATKGGLLPPYATIQFDDTVSKDGFLWAKYKGYTGDTLYVPISDSKIKYGTITYK